MSTEPEVWHILIQPGDGKQISLLKNLTATMCREVVQRLLPGTSPWQLPYLPEQALYDADPEAWRAQKRRQHERQKASAGRFHGYYLGLCPHEPERPMGPEMQSAIQWWGPEGEALEIWPKPADWDDRYQSALEAAKLVHATNKEIEEAHGHR